MENTTLAVKKRDTQMKTKMLRQSSVIPAVSYGKGQEPLSIQMDYQTFRKLYELAGTNTIITLEGEGLSDVDVLVQDVEYDPVTDAIIHVDFMKIEKGKPVHAMVPIHLTGKSPAVAELGGTLIHQKHEVEIKCLPKDLIHEFEISIDGLVDFHHSIHVSDLKVSSGVEILDHPEDVIVNVSAPRVEQETEEEETPEPVKVGAESKEESAE